MGAQLRDTFTKARGLLLPLNVQPARSADLAEALAERHWMGTSPLDPFWRSQQLVLQVSSPYCLVGLIRRHGDPLSQALHCGTCLVEGEVRECAHGCGTHWSYQIPHPPEVA